jgi:hypothetical protein
VGLIERLLREEQVSVDFPFKGLQKSGILGAEFAEEVVLVLLDDVIQRYDWV